MFTTPAPAAPTLSTSSSQASPSSPTRASRLRGLHYLRSYTHSHLHSSQPSSALHSPVTLPPVTRSQSQPGESSGIPRDDFPDALVEPPSANIRLTAPETSSVQRSSTPGSTAGWVPSAGARSGTSRISAQADSSASSRVAGGAILAGAETESPASYTPMRPMTRNRAETAVGAPAPAPAPQARAPSSSAATRTISAPDVHVHEPSNGKANGSPLPTIRFTPHQDARSNRQSLVFPSISRTLPSQNTIIRVGRYSERDSTTGYANEPAPGTPSGAPVGFKSKVVSRRHCEFWCSNSQWFVKDVGSSSGTFLNHIRLSQPGVESKPYVVSDGDVVQLGIDFRGGEEMIFRCVKIRVECNRGWQKGLNKFNKSTHKRLKNLAKSRPKVDGDNASTHTSECSICLMSIAPCQSLFVAPCSHVWHYKCIRPILNGSTWPNFLCPNCRAVADLEADVDEEEVDWSEEEDAAAETEMKKAIEQSLQESRSDPSIGARADATGGPTQSADAPDMHDRLGTLASPIDLDSSGGAADGSAPPRLSSDGRVASYGQGMHSTREESRSRTPKSQHSARASSRSTRQTSQQQQQQPRPSDELYVDAELAHLVSNMGLIAPTRTPPPPPPPPAGAGTFQARQASNGSLPIPISGPAGAGAVGRSSHDSSRHGSRQVSRVQSNDSDGGRQASRVHSNGSERGRTAPSVSMTSHAAAAADNDTTMHLDLSDEESAADAGFGVGFGVPGAVRSRFHRGNPPSALTPVSLGSGSGSGSERRRGSEQLEVDGRAAADVGDPDFPMTPRNDAGPFILDGSGGRA